MSGVLVDTSVWVDHFRRKNTALVNLLAIDLVFTHPMVVTELACGTPPAPRTQTLADIGALPPVRQASLGEVRQLIERENLYGKGCGVVDLVLLASALITPGAKLWTLDRRLAQLAQSFSVSYEPPEQ